MKFYKDDGTFIIEQDTDFGWWLRDIVPLETCKKCEPVIPIFPIKKVQETLLNPEGLIETGKNVFYDVNFLKEKLCNITPTNIWKSKLLLSVINFSLFKKLSEGSISRFEENINLKRYKVHQKISKTRRKLNCFQSDQLKCSKSYRFNEKIFECLTLLQKNLQILDTKIKEMRHEAFLIKVFFERTLQEENDRLRILLNECRKCSQELKECNYLNEIVLLLMGKVEKIKSSNWPFRICSNNKKELNLIV